MNRTVVIVVAGGLLVSAGHSRAESAGPSSPPAGQITFTDVAVGGGAGIDYRRQRSPSDAAFDILKAQPIYTFADLVATPVKSRGAPGVAVLDFDRDGDLDLYVTNGPGAANSLYSNQLRETGTMTFLDLGVSAGVAAVDQDSTGVCYGDIDNDGDHDLYVLGNSEPNRLFVNQGNGAFLDFTAESGAGGHRTASLGCAMGDVNNDGLLDVVVGNLASLSNNAAIFVEPFLLNQPNQLFVNQEGNVFVEASASSGLLELAIEDAASPECAVPAEPATLTWAIAMVDYDLDGDLDVFQADQQGALGSKQLGCVDRGVIRILQNDGGGSFTDVTATSGTGRVSGWMGLSFGDFNGDGRLDVFGANFGNRNRLLFVPDADFDLEGSSDSRWFLQRADGTFADRSDQGQLFTPMGAGTSAADYDNDGDTDIVMHGGFDVGPFVTTGPGTVLRNDGQADFSRDSQALAGSTDHVRRNVKGMAVGDLDNNGFIDIVSVSNFDFPEPVALSPLPPQGGAFDVDAFIVETFAAIDPANFIFQWNGLELPDGTLSVELSSGNGNGWAQIEVMGTVGLTPEGRVNRDGIGAVLRFEPEAGQAVLQPILGGASYASQDSLIAVFGLGAAQWGTVEVLWPGGVRNRLYRVRSGERIVLPEIPCSFAGTDPVRPYLRCVRIALRDLLAAGIVDKPLALRLFLSAVRAFIEERQPAVGLAGK